MPSGAPAAASVCSAGRVAGGWMCVPAERANLACRRPATEGTADELPTLSTLGANGRTEATPREPMFHVKRADMTSGHQRPRGGGTHDGRLRDASWSVRARHSGGGIGFRSGTRNYRGSSETGAQLPPENGCTGRVGSDSGARPLRLAGADASTQCFGRPASPDWSAPMRARPRTALPVVRHPSRPVGVSGLRQVFGARARSCWQTHVGARRTCVAGPCLAPASHTSWDRWTIRPRQVHDNRLDRAKGSNPANTARWLCAGRAHDPVFHVKHCIP